MFPFDGFYLPNFVMLQGESLKPLVFLLFFSWVIEN